jgi:hypothetical protein
LPAALVLDARAVVLETDGVRETDLAEVLAKRQLLLGLRWREPALSGYLKTAGEAGGPPPFIVAAAVHADADGHRRLRVAVRDGYEVLSGNIVCDADTGTDRLLNALEGTEVGTLDASGRAVIRRHVTELLGGLAGR